MNTPKNIVVLYDWTGTVAISELFNSLEQCLEDFWLLLKTDGVLKNNTKQSNYKSLSLDNCIGSNKLEVYGSLKSKKDIRSSSAYLFYEQSEISTIILCGELLLIESVFGWLKKLSETITIEYGYMNDCSVSSNAVLEAFGVTFGYPKTNEEEKKAKQDSRWFEERLYLSGKRRMRHLNGLFRAIYKVNFINDQHLLLKIDGSSLRHHLEVNPIYGKLFCLKNGSYIWVVPPMYLDRVRGQVESAGGLI